MKFTGTDSYVATEDLMIAVNASITLERPLLVKGEPGTGKTMLAEEVARALGAPLIQWHIKSTTKAAKGLYEYDAVARLRDSQLGDGKVHDISNYIVQGKIWGNARARDYQAMKGKLLPKVLESFQRLQAEAHLVLVENPAHNSSGDFALREGRVRNGGTPRFTFSGIGVYHPRLFAGCRPGAFPLGPLLRAACDRDLVSGELFRGHWTDVGTPERLQELDRMLNTRSVVTAD